MSNRSKGMQYEREYENILQLLGYQTQRVKGSTRWNKNVDFFGVWDIIAFNKHGWLLVQVKSQFLNETENMLKEWFEKQQPPRTEAVLVIRKKGKPKKFRWDYVNIGDTR